MADTKLTTLAPHGELAQEQLHPSFLLPYHIFLIIHKASAQLIYR